jgi:S-adenosylmethionine/arginine decarboxylase-like enzyme
MDTKENYQWTHEIVMDAIYYECERLPKTKEEFDILAKTIAELMKIKIVDSNFYVHQGSEGGITSTYVVETSHLVISTWPEYGDIRISLGSCSPYLKPTKNRIKVKKELNNYMKENFGCKDKDIKFKIIPLIREERGLYSLVKEKILDLYERVYEFFF